ncbi:MAG: hypothetical protein AB1305_00265, partial [Candidatus Hadarchaeota archaeon]
MALEGLDGKYVDIGASGALLIVLLALAVCLPAYYILRKKVEKKLVLAVLGLFLAGYAFRMFFMLRNPLVYGIDGPYYVEQVNSIVATGAPSEPAVEPLILYLASGASVFTNDATLGIKITQAFLSALPILTIWLLVYYLTRSKLASFAAALLMTFSAVSMGISDALRNAGALAFLPSFYLFFFKFVNGEGPEWKLKALKIWKMKVGLALNLNLLLSFIIYLLIIASHFLTAGFVVMTVVAYIAFFTGYRRKIPWKELKFMMTLAIAVLLGMAASSTVRGKIFAVSNDLAKSDPVPSGLFPFSESPLPVPPGGEGGAPPSFFMIMVPLILLALPAMLFSLHHKDKRYLLFTATIPLVILCMQTWIVNYMYGFRFFIMVYVALYVLGGVSVWCLRDRAKKVSAAVLAAGIVFSLVSIAGMAAGTSSWISQETWNQLSWIGRRLPENSIITTSEGGLFYWGQLVFGKTLGSSFLPGWASSLSSLAMQMRQFQNPDNIVLAVVNKNIAAGENLQKLGLQLYDNLQTENYIVLKLDENSDNTISGYS